MKKIGIYIHIPFCKKKCKYCDFISFDDKINYQEKYIESVLNEIENCDKTNFIVNTIYFGGGTPSFISENLIIRVLEKIKEKFEVEENSEITIEVNPGTVDEKKLEVYKNAGFNRISIGLQASQDIILKSIGRIHNYKDFEKCFKLADKVLFSLSIVVSIFSYLASFSL